MGSLTGEVRTFVHIGWDVMLVITIVTFLMVGSRLIPRRRR